MSCNDPIGSESVVSFTTDTLTIRSQLRCLERYKQLRPADDALYAARIEDLGPGDFVKVACVACVTRRAAVKLRLNGYPYTPCSIWGRVRAPTGTAMAGATGGWATPSPNQPNTNISASTAISMPAVISGIANRFGESESAIAGRML
jgi:hypothetical protein